MKEFPPRALYLSKKNKTSLTESRLDSIPSRICRRSTSFCKVSIDSLCELSSLSNLRDNADKVASWVASSFLFMSLTPLYKSPPTMVSVATFSGRSNIDMNLPMAIVSSSIYITCFPSHYPHIRAPLYRLSGEIVDSFGRFEGGDVLSLDGSKGL